MHGLIGDLDAGEANHTDGWADWDRSSAQLLPDQVREGIFDFRMAGYRGGLAG